MREIDKIGVHGIAVDHPGEAVLPVVLLLEVRRHVGVVDDPVVLLGLAVEEVEAVADAAHDLGGFLEARLVVLGVREGLDLGGQLGHGAEAAAAVPGGVVELLGAAAHAQVLRQDGRAVALVEGRLRVVPVAVAVLPLEGVVVEPAAQGGALGEVAVLQQRDGGGTGDLVQVRDEQHVA